ncbi:MAG TPA: hypothetical protein VFI69_02315 [Candidatus Limnocylindrales bacterium]|jgi:hypothetical protein|nr:hypothetical protein [Candidatus Limnocylindrales bacterium]
MKRSARILIVIVAIFGSVAAGCSPQASTAANKEAAIVVEDQPSGLKLLTLSGHAAKRLGVQTVEVTTRGSGLAIPYAAVIYDSKGGTWAYAASEALTFQRAAIAIDTIDGDEALLSDGPEAGTSVVTVGAAELYGAETGVGGGH